MDNLSSHKGAAVPTMIEAAGARLLYLPPYSSDFNPLENAFAKLIFKHGTTPTSSRYSTRRRPRLYALYESVT